MAHLGFLQHVGLRLARQSHFVHLTLSTAAQPLSPQDLTAVHPGKGELVTAELFPGHLRRLAKACVHKGRHASTLFSSAGTPLVELQRSQRPCVCKHMSLQAVSAVASLPCAGPCTMMDGVMDALSEGRMEDWPRSWMACSRAEVRDKKGCVPPLLRVFALHSGGKCSLQPHLKLLCALEH